MCFVLHANESVLLVFSFLKREKKTILGHGTVLQCHTYVSMSILRVKPSLMNQSTV